MARTALLSLLPAALVAGSWLRLEQPRERPLVVLLVAALGIAPALLRAWRWRVAALVPAAAIAAWIALGPAPFEARPRSGHDYFGPLADRFRDGLVEYYDVTLPFTGAEHPQMHGLVVLAVFAFSAALALGIASGRPLPALLATIAGVGWPATLLPGRGLVLGALTLAACLAVLAGLRRSGAGAAAPALVAGALLVAAAVAASTSASVAKDGILAWQSWDVFDRPERPVRVDYVWDGRYGGIEFPKQKTVVLRIYGPERGRYWRATALDVFTADRWIEGLVPLVTRRPGTGIVPEEALTPRGARDQSRWLHQTVDVVALADDHLVAATTPTFVQALSLPRVYFLSGGIMRADRALRRGERYEVFSFSPEPRPGPLARAGTAYPDAAGRFLDIGRTRVDPFGTPGREARVEAIFDDERLAPLWPYRGLYRRAVEIAGDAGSPYGATVAIEAWLRSAGGFEYDETPPRTAGLPPLAAFVEVTKAGYCQHFAGAMALMLRFLGVPARVAAGFTSGKRNGNAWIVTDHDAHAWVEVWFPRFGWLAFDPTPGRGELSGTYTTSSQAFNARDTLDALNAAGGSRAGFDPGTGIGALLAAKERNLGGSRLAPVRDHGPGLLRILAVLSASAAAVIGVVKLVRRRRRYLTRDPRRLAAAARRELADYLVDQRLEIPVTATADELSALVERELGLDARAFAAAAGAARFGPPREAGAAARHARREVRVLLRVLRARLTRRERVRGFLALRSLRAR